MKKPTLIAAVVLLALLGAFVALQAGSDKPQQEQAWRLEPFQDLDRVQINGPQGDFTLVYANKAWRLSQPIDFPVDKEAADQLDLLLRRGVLMDLTLDAPQLDKYDLGEGAPTVTLSGGGQTRRFRLGKDITVPGTDARRSFVQPEGDDKVYRAQASLFALLGRDLEHWREKQILDFDPPQVQKIDLRYDNKTVTLARQDSTWTSSEAFAVDDSAVESFLEAASRLKVEAFLDDTDPAKAGLDKPSLALTLHLTGADPVTLLLGGEIDGKRVLQRQGQPWIYALNPSTERNLDKRMGHFRPRDVSALDTSTIETLTLTPEGASAPVTLRRQGKDWALDKPIEGVKLDPGIVNALTLSLGSLKAQRMAEREITPEQAGLTPEKAHQIVLGLTGGTSTLILLGDALGASQDRYARIADGEIFVLDAYKAQKLRPTRDTLLRPDQPAHP